MDKVLETSAPVKVPVVWSSSSTFIFYSTINLRLVRVGLFCSTSLSYHPERTPEPTD